MTVPLRFLVTYLTVMSGRSYYKNMTFASSEDYALWLQNADAIKLTIASINEDDPDSGSSVMGDPIFNRLLNWVDMVSVFAANYGKHKVPIDIRNAMHEVQNHLSLPLMDFGPDVGAAFEKPNRIYPERP